MTHKKQPADDRLHSVFLSGLCFLIAGLLGCSTKPSNELQLAADRPSPSTIRFEAQDIGLNADARFNEIIVYDTSDCSLPECPIVWHVALPDNSGPANFIYGGIPTFGSQTIVPAKPLVEGRTYELKVGPSDPRFPYSSGRLPFKIEPSGALRPLSH